MVIFNKENDGNDHSPDGFRTSIFSDSSRWRKSNDDLELYFGVRVRIFFRLLPGVLVGKMRARFM